LQYIFKWDPVKARGNVRKHGVTFERAASVLADPRALTIFDERHSSDEDRWITLGLDKTGMLLVVSHTFIEEARKTAVLRIISARKATNNEAKQYQGST
jgi:uncharacterized protein